MVNDVYLLIDKRVWQHASGIWLVPGRVEKDPANPLLQADKPWEFRLDNMYANVIYEEDKSKFACWYSPFRTWTPPKEPENREVIVCYAESTNGIDWDKPELGLLDFEGNRNNNIVMMGPYIPNGPSTGCSRGPHGTGVMYDAADPNPEKRFKAIFKHDQRDHNGGDDDKNIYVTFSRDGLVWSKGSQCNTIKPRGNTHHSVFWEAISQRYVAIIRRYVGKSIKNLAMATSKDFVTWTEATVILHDDPRSSREPYAMIVFPYYGLYLGLLMMRNKLDTVDCELAWSPDLYTWERIHAGRAFIKRDKGYDRDCVFAAAHPIECEEGVLIYYAGSAGKHLALDRMTGLCLARIGKYRFAAIEPVERKGTGVLITRPIYCIRKGIAVTADATNGQIRVSVVGHENNGLVSSITVNKGLTDSEITWENADKLASLLGQNIQLRFELEDVCLYAFKFVD